ncbi:MAG TPA: SIS domain-containing protein [Geminicoccaceae bacterium]|nr:SIS domain-containing protein [Geminicoccus sp.]HMU48176.1 SIS domain-containing protein [Geminicoccaceae bacterium]
MSLDAYLAASAEVLEATRRALPQAAIDGAVAAIVQALRAGRPLLVCGNGGSAADAQHITAELVGRFLRERPGLRVICLADNAAVLTAWANDYSYETVFARQVEAYGGEGAVLLGLSTSGNSPNVVAAFVRARDMGMATIALTGEGGGRLAPLTDHLLAVPSRRTPLIQQAHLCLYHYLCEAVEAAFA